MQRMVAILGLLLTTAVLSVYAQCVCRCVDGSVQPICTSSIDVRPICSPTICPIVPPSVQPIPKPQIPPIGTNNCVQKQVLNPQNQQYEWMTLCSNENEQDNSSNTITTTSTAAQTWTYQGNSSCYHYSGNTQCFENGTLQRYATGREQFEAGYRIGQEAGQAIGLLIQAWMAHRRQLNLEREDIRGQITGYYHATYDLDDEIAGYEEAMISAYNRLQNLDPPRRSMYEDAERSAETLVAHLGQMRPMTEKNLPGILAAKDIKFLQSNLELSQKFYNQALEASKKEYVFSQLISAYAGSLESSQSASRFYVVTPLPVSTVSSAPPTPAPTSASVEPAPSPERIAAIRELAASGNAEAQYNLGLLYDSGQGVPQDYAQEAAWYRKAAEQGNANAQTALGAMYFNGQGVPQDKAQAAVWWHKAADQGNADGQFGLGLQYDHGSGVPQDYAEAYFWLDLAAASNVSEVTQKDTAKARDDAASHLTPADLSREQERARQWFEAHPAKPQ